MTEEEQLQQDQEVARSAEAALSAAQQRALQSGRPVLLVVNGQLVEVNATDHRVIKSLPGRQKARNRVKQANP